MTDDVLVSKDEANQSPVPNMWRSTFCHIVEAFKDGDFRLGKGIVGVCPISSLDAATIEENLRSYGATLTSLPERTWETSVSQWMQGYWDVLIDLFTVEEGASDLVLAARVYEQGRGYAFEIQSVYVP